MARNSADDERFGDVKKLIAGRATGSGCGLVERQSFSDWEVSGRDQMWRLVKCFGMEFGMAQWLSDGWWWELLGGGIYV